MQRSLKRLCVLRQLQEDAEQAQYRSACSYLATIEKMQAQEAQRTRSLAVAVQAHLVAGARSDAFPCEVELELAPVRRQQLAAIADGAQRALICAQEGWMESRRRRMEAETVHAAAERVRKIQADRKEQKTMDEWFLLRPVPHLSESSDR